MTGRVVAVNSFLFRQQRGVRLPEERKQVGHVLQRQALFEPVRHQRFSIRLQLFDPAALNRYVRRVGPPEIMPRAFA